jgi:LruC domain-containing protein
MKHAFLPFLYLCLVIAGCEPETSNTPSEQVDMNNLVIPPGFTYQTTVRCSLGITLKSSAGEPLSGIRINAAIDGTNKKIIIGGFATGDDGKIEATLQVPAYVTKIYLQTDYLGLPPEATVEIVNGKAICNYNSSNATKSATEITSGMVQILSGNTVIQSAQGYSADGVPSDLAATSETVTSSRLKDMNASLPPFSKADPAFLSAGIPENIILNQDADVWITFLNDQTDNKNILGYYTYDRNHPPVIRKNIDTIHIVFPNASYEGSGGGLISGNRVKLGHFEANTAIGWVCIADGFRNGRITEGSFLFYSNSALNPESETSFRKHSVLIRDNEHAGFLLAFEDHNRNAVSMDDFNDMVFFITVSPGSVYDADHFTLKKTSVTDTDLDGIADPFDEYPKDANKAFNNYYPSSADFATLAFEDNWPAKGEYDMNDLMIGYQVNQVTNSRNKIISLEGKYVIKAVGSSLHDGFGFALPVDPSVVSSATGSRLSTSLTSLSSAGIENSTTETVFILFDDAWNVIPPVAATQPFFNTDALYPYIASDTLKIKMDFLIAQSQDDLGMPPYNPFIFADHDRSKEIHLPDMPPTSKANRSLFGTYDDHSDENLSRYYKSADNLPWAISVNGNIDPATETTAFTLAYMKFASWCQSGGNSNADWYLNRTGNFNPRYLFKP